MYTFIWLHWAPGAGHRTLDSRWGTQTPRCGVWGLVLCPGIEPRLSALGVWSLSHWTPRAVPVFYKYNFLSEILILIYSLVGQILSSRVQTKGPWTLDCLHSWMLENARLFCSTWKVIWLRKHYLSYFSFVQNRIDISPFLPDTLTWTILRWLSFFLSWCDLFSLPRCLTILFCFAFS